jgi:hypothetical protein
LKIERYHPLEHGFVADLGSPMEIDPCLKVFICLDFDATQQTDLRMIPAKVIRAEHPAVIAALPFNEHILKTLEYHDSHHS